MKEWKDVEKRMVEKYLKGDEKTAKLLYHHINIMVYSKEILPALYCEYPSVDETEMSNGGELLTDADVLRGIRVRMATLIFQGAKRKIKNTQEISDKSFISFISYWLTYNWPIIINNYLKKLERIMSSNIVSKFL